jgi:ABC-type phosphate transport system auxiliary subunit
LEKFFGVGGKNGYDQKSYRNYTPNKLCLTFNSKNSRDLFLMSVRCFEAQITLEDGLIFEQVKRKLNEDLSEDKDNSISLLAANEQLMREVTFLYENNSQLNKENERQTSVIRNLEGELSRSVNCKIFSNFLFF